MSHLSFGDASFLYMETDKVPTHAATLQIFEVPKEKQSKHVEDFRRIMFDRRYLVPYLTHRLCFVPGNIDHPEWVDDATFDTEFHVRSVDLGGEGTMRDLEDTVADLHQQRIPLDRPLWRTVIITGLAGGQVAHYSAVHHSCVDGMGGQQPLHLLADPSPEVVWRNPEARQPEREPSQTSLYLRALGRLAKANVAQLRGIPQGVQTVGSLVNRAFSPKKSFGALAAGAPKTSFNVEIDKGRSLALGQMPLSEFKALSKALDCTINDTFMTITAGALRRFFIRKNELPVDPLIAGCPVSVRQSGDESQNNQVTTMLVSLATDIEDPLKRLAAIRESAQVGKDVTAELYSSGSPDIEIFGLPSLMAGSIRLAENLHLAESLGMLMNLTVSNVPGPRDPLYSNGAEMLAMYPVSLALHGTGVNLTVISYRGSMDFAITSATCALAEPQELRDDFIAAYDELRELVLGAPAKKERKSEERLRAV
jgi:WS/DGAT/MGAT family acyltransferase